MKIFQVISSLIISVLIMCCNGSVKSAQPINAEEILAEAYEVAGMAKLENSTMIFRFRDKEYKAKRATGLRIYERLFSDSTGMFRDVLEQNKFTRYIDEEKQMVPDSMATRYAESINSVHYFSVLPYGLKDGAVNASYIDSITLKGKPYHKIKVTFDQQGGGIDFEDEFIYWINSDTRIVDFLAYSFKTNGGGLRFREAYNPRIINGIRIVDYKNYKPKVGDIKLDELDQAHLQGDLELLSTIALENVQIN